MYLYGNGVCLLFWFGNMYSLFMVWLKPDHITSCCLGVFLFFGGIFYIFLNHYIQGGIKSWMELLIKFNQNINRAKFCNYSSRLTKILTVRNSISRYSINFISCTLSKSDGEFVLGPKIHVCNKVFFKNLSHELDASSNPISFPIIIIEKFKHFSYLHSFFKSQWTYATYFAKNSSQEHG